MNLLGSNPLERSLTGHSSVLLWSGGDFTFISTYLSMDPTSSQLYVRRKYPNNNGLPRRHYDS